MLPQKVNYLEHLVLRAESLFWVSLLLLCWIMFERCEGEAESASKVQQARNFVAVFMYNTPKDHLG